MGRKSGTKTFCSVGCHNLRGHLHRNWQREMQTHSKLPYCVQIQICRQAGISSSAVWCSEAATRHSSISTPASSSRHFYIIPVSPTQLLNARHAWRHQSSGTCSTLHFCILHNTAQFNAAANNAIRLNVHKFRRPNTRRTFPCRQLDWCCSVGFLIRVSITCWVLRCFVVRSEPHQHKHTYQQNAA